MSPATRVSRRTLTFGLALAMILATLASWRPVPAAAAATSLTINQITIETRHYPFGPPGSTVAAIEAFNIAPTFVGGYTNAPVSLNHLNGVSNQSLVPGGSSSNIAFHFKIDVTSPGSSIVPFRFGIDFGRGGTFLVDGAVVQERWTSMWWNFNGLADFADPNQFLQGNVVLSKGPHVIELYGFEDCCDGPTLSQLDIFDGNGWQTINLTPDTTPPTVTCTAAPAQLWPPNHKMVPVGVQVDVSDDDSGPNGYVLEAATSSEADDGLGDGDTANDLQNWTLDIPDDFGALRAERSGGGDGRVYILTYRGFDRAGNSTTCDVHVVVPHSR